ncbi:MAG: hypothetical protein GX434_17580 [Peptococcaceae bacterium]|nr:hypothetical protein [Peptococcaceae bacterium]
MMRFFPFLLGILGGLICLCCSFQYLFLNHFEVPISITYIGTLKNIRMALLPFSMIGLIGGYHIRFDLVMASKLTLFASASVFLLLRPLYIFGCLLLFIAGVFSFVYLQCVNNEIS